MTPPITHGGRLLQARRQFPHAPEPWIDLSTGINPVPYVLPPLPQQALTRLPEPEDVAALEAIAAAAYGVADPACAVAAAGTQAIIHLLPRLRAPGAVAVLAPTYAEHAAAWRLAGHRVAEVATLDALHGAEVAVLCRPNNPDGRVLPAEALLSLADDLASRGGLLVVDEAFADFEGCSLAAALPRPGLMLLRSLGKAYGLAGVRLGFALTGPAHATALREALGPWAVSGVALHAGCHALADTPWRYAAARRLANDAASLDQCLVGAGCRVLGGTRLFRLAAHPEAASLADRLGAAGILVRRFASEPTWLRFGLPGGEADRRRLEIIAMHAIGGFHSK